MNEIKSYLRFTLPMRLEHWAVTISFTLLVLTGIPQKFADWGISDAIIGLFGGIEMTRNIHHFAAIVLSLVAIYHIVVVAYKIFVLRVRWTMFPRIDDAIDAMDAVRYNLGLAKSRPKTDRYSFEEKAEYWAMVWGTIIMAVTGFIMWNPINSARFMPGDWIPAAKAAHGAEAILAALAIVVWHFYNVHIKTFNKTVFTGKLTEKQMEHEHPLELERIQQGIIDAPPSPQDKTKRERVFIPVAVVLSVFMLALLYLFTTYERTAITTLPRRSQVQVFAPLTPTPFLRGTSVPGSNIVAKPLPASHEGRTTCLACHAALPQPAMPADHAGRTDPTCSACHKIGGAAPAPTGQATQAPATAAPGATAAPKPTSAPASSNQIPPMPLGHERWTTCLGCHAALPQPALPADHAGRTDQTCVACHKLTTSSAPAATAAPATKAPGTPTAATPAAGATSAPASSAGLPQVLPADHAGRTTCLACHATLPQPALPTDHTGRTETTCIVCHKLP